MATRSSMRSILILVGVLAIFAGNSHIAIGGSFEFASFNVAYGDEPGTNPNDIKIDVHCYDNVGTNLPVATLIPGQNLYHHWTPSPAVNSIWDCDFKAVIAGDTFTQSFQVWKHDPDAAFLNQCNECQWKIAVDGFEWFSGQDEMWKLEYLWIQSA